MAQKARSVGVYLPDLDKCFSGESQALSWCEVFAELDRNRQSSPKSSALSFLSSPGAKNLLLETVPSFPKPSTQARTNFDSRTAAINATTPDQTTYSIEQIKEDALCLSKTVELDEIEALRIIILEWQQRPAARLNDGVSETEKASLKSALGIDDTAVAGPLFSELRQSNDAQSQFDTPSQRRARQLILYFEESTGMIGTRRALMVIALEGSTEHKQNSVGITPDFDELLTVVAATYGIGTVEQNISKCISSFQSTLDEHSTQTSQIMDNHDADDTLYDVSTQETLRRTTLIMELILLYLFPHEVILPAQIVLTWLDTITNVAFFLYFEPLSSAQAKLLDAAQSLSAVLTAAILCPLVSIASLADESQIRLLPSTDKPYVLEVDQIGKLNQHFLSLSSLGVVPAAPATFAWGLIVHAIIEQAEGAKERREAQHEQRALDQGMNPDSNTGRRMSSSSASSAQQSVYEELADAINASSDVEEPVQFMIHKAVEQAHVFDMISTISAQPPSDRNLLSLLEISVLQDLVYIALPPLGYSPEALAAQLSILSFNAEKTRFSKQTLHELNLDPRSEFLKNSVGQELLDTAISRFPYESLPMLELCESLAGADVYTDQGTQEINYRLQEMMYFTQSVSSAFSAYNTTREEEDRNWVVLEQNVCMLNGTNHQLLSGADSGVIQDLIVPAKATGRMISEEKPHVVTWSVRYSAFAYMGAWLSQYRHGHAKGAVSAFESPEVVAAAIINLLTAVLERKSRSSRNASEDGQRAEYARTVIEEMQSAMSHGSDLIAVVSDILEHEIPGLRHSTRSSVSRQIVVACLKFLRVVLWVIPDRAWSVISRSSLIDLRASNGAAFLNLAATEGAQEDCSLFEASSLLYHDLVEATLKHAGQRPADAGSHRSVTFYTGSGESMPEHFFSQVLFACTKIMVEVFITSSKWRKESGLTQTCINATLCQTFENIISYTYGSDDHGDLGQKLTRSLASSATYLVESFLATPGDTTMTEPLIYNLLAGLNVSEGNLIPGPDVSLMAQSQSTLSLSLLLLQTRVFLDRPRTSLEHQLLDAMPLLIRLAAQGHFTSAALALMRHLLSAEPSGQGMSLLGCLGSQSSYCFLEELNRLKRQHDNEQHMIDAWSLAATLVGGNQQWVAIMLLTGCPPKPPKRAKIDTEEDQSSLMIRGKSFSQEALEGLSHIQHLAPKTASAMLKFLVRAQTSWSWSSRCIQSYPDFLSAIVSYVVDYVADMDNPLRECYHNQNVGVILELSTVYLHHARSSRDSAAIKKMAPMMTWLTNNVCNVTGNNLSLHSNLRKNFSTRYRPLTLTNFKRTQLQDAQLGEKYVYNVELADKVLLPDQAWSRPGSDKTFSHEFRRANLNLSLVETQVYLLQSFKGFCIEHCSYFVQDRETQKTMSHITQNCLKANAKPRPPEKMFDDIYESRANFALALMQHLVNAKARGSDFVTLLPSAWDVIRAGNPSYESAIANDDLAYYRTCLTTLILTLQFHIGKRVRTTPSDSDNNDIVRQSDPSSLLVLDIAATVVAEGLRSVVSTMHDREQSDDGADTRDLSLLLNLLQTILRLPSLPQITAQLSDCFVSSGVAQSCLMLYSWSQHRTASGADDSVASAILVMRFLVSLSSLPGMAEALAIDGILNRLSVTRLTQSIITCPDGASQFDRRSSCQTLYLIWATGLLPLCLNLLHSVGRAMAGEISGFLNQFPEQLRLASKTFAKGNVTMLMAEEAATLALISYALQSYRQAGASAGVDVFDIEALSGYDDHRITLTEDIEDLLSSGKRLKERIIATNEREFSWQRTDDGDVLKQKIFNSLNNAVLCMKAQSNETEMQ